jgi:parallel beta-helix repeat protein
MNKLIILLMAMLIFALGSGIGATKEVTVNSTDSIRAAVNNASSGDVIIVKPGVYNESIRITTQNLVIRSESGNPEDTIIRTDSYGFNVTATASNTTISGFKIDSAETGIKLDRCSGCTISNNEISGNRANKDKFGIQLYYCNGNTLLNNSLNLNVRGIDSIHSDNNIIIDNIVLNNSQYGMWISVSNYNDISGNTVNGCGDGRPSGSGGIHLNSATGNIISGNIVAFTNGYGLFECRACRRNHMYNNYINVIY